MRTTRIYQPGTLQTGQRVILHDNAANHVARVLRLQAGAPLTLFNGAGGEYAATLAVVGKREVEVEIGAFQATATESPLRLTLAQGIAKGERMDYVVQKAVELGVTRLAPLITEHCAVNLSGERMEKRLRHWQAIAIGACEQSGRNILPEMAMPVTLEQWLHQPLHGIGIMLDPRAARTLQQLPAAAAAVTLLIGPEGGLSEGETGRAGEAGYQGVRLGPRVLRTETAAVTAATLVQARWGDLER